MASLGFPRFNPAAPPLLVGPVPGTVVRTTVLRVDTRAIVDIPFIVKQAKAAGKDGRADLRGRADAGRRLNPDADGMKRAPGRARFGAKNMPLGNLRIGWNRAFLLILLQ